MRVQRTSRRVARLSGCLLVCLSPCFLVSARGFDPVIDSPMYTSPPLPPPPSVKVFPEGALRLWLRALARPEADLKCKAAAAIARAHRLGMKGLAGAIAPLVAALDRTDQDPAVRLAVAQALIALEARQAAPDLLRQARSGSSEFRALVEPALAQWAYRPAGELWLERLRAPAAAPGTLLLAIRGLAAIQEDRAADRLRELVLSPREAGSIRLEAARALGVLRAEGLEKDAADLAAAPSVHGTVGRLAAAALLQRHRGEEAVRLLQRLAQEPEPAVAAVAAGRLVAIDPTLALPVLDQLLASPDATVRALGVETLRRRPTKKPLRLLGARLDDPHPKVRVQARHSLRELADKKEFHDLVISEAVAKLAGTQWQAQEQATILLVQLDHKPVGRRLVELLSSDRPEVFVTAAWGLRKLAVREMLPAVVRYVDAVAGQLLGGGPLPRRIEASFEAIDHQLSQLNQFLGQQKHAAADEVLRRFLPRTLGVAPGAESRAAAVWALGLIHEGKKNPDLVRLMEERLNATSTIPPEYPQVRRMAALALGRLQGKEALPSLRRYFTDRQPSDNPINNACGWAIERLTGEAVPPPKPIPKPQGGWFLTPTG